MTKRTRTIRRLNTARVAAATASGLFLLSCYGPNVVGAFSVGPGMMVSYTQPASLCTLLRMSANASGDEKDGDQEENDAPAGSFFHQVPPPSSNDEITDGLSDDTTKESESTEPKSPDDEFNDAVSKLLQQRRRKPLASQPSTINGIPTATGFGKPMASKKTSSKGVSKPKRNPISPYVAIGTPDQPINDPSKPERDDQGYTLYTDTQTGEKSRVFEALVDYPSIFTMKIVGANEGTFVSEMVALVAEACETNVDNVKHTTKVMGKWVSVTVKAPVQSAEMLYSLYEKVDMDPRVKFKF